MIRTGRTTRTAAGAGLLAGIALAGLLVFSNALPRGRGTLGADLTVTALPSGELEISPGDVFLRANDLRPS